MARKKTTTSKSSSTKSNAIKPKKLENLQQTTGKVYGDQVSRAKELEEILGIPKINPFKTKNKQAFQEMLQDMNLTDLQSFAVKVGVFPSGNKTVLRNKIKKEFNSSLHGKGSIQLMGEPVKLDPNNPRDREVIDYLKN